MSNLKPEKVFATAAWLSRQSTRPSKLSAGKVSLKKTEAVSFDENSVQVFGLKFEAALKLTKNFKQVSHC